MNANIWLLLQIRVVDPEKLLPFDQVQKHPWIIRHCVDTGQPSITSKRKRNRQVANLLLMACDDRYSWVAVAYDTRQNLSRMRRTTGVQVFLLRVMKVNNWLEAYGVRCRVRGLNVQIEKDWAPFCGLMSFQVEMASNLPPKTDNLSIWRA